MGFPLWIHEAKAMVSAPLLISSLVRSTAFFPRTSAAVDKPDDLNLFLHIGKNPSLFSHCFKIAGTRTVIFCLAAAYDTQFHFPVPFLLLSFSMVSENYNRFLPRHTALLIPAYFLYAKRGSPSLSGTFTSPWIRGRAYSINSLPTSEPFSVIHSAGTPFSWLQI